MKIVIEIRDDNDELIAKREALDSFESAGENLGKLESYYKKYYEKNNKTSTNN